jgi:hypothetical protein
MKFPEELQVSYVILSIDIKIFNRIIQKIGLECLFSSKHRRHNMTNYPIYFV